MKKMLKSFAAFVFVAVMALLIFGQPAKATETENITVYVSVEKFSLGQGYLIEPTKMTVAKESLASDVVIKLLEENGYGYEVDTSWGYQLTYIKDADNGTIDIPQIIQTMAEDPWCGAAPTNETAKANGNATYPDLGNYSYTSAAGWTYYVNNESPYVSMNEYTLQDGDVMRIRFTIHGYGSDMGGSWDGCLTLPNLDSVTKSLAEYNADKANCDLNKTYKSAYAKTVKAVTDMDNTEETITAAAQNLPTEKQITTWAKKVKNNTPKKATLKTVKNSTSTRVRLTWKKASKVTGYEIYYKVTGSKASYKKLKTITKASTTSYKTKKLKKNKTYSFKIRAYKTVSGNKIYGKFSSVKKLKVK